MTVNGRYKQVLVRVATQKASLPLSVKQSGQNIKLISCKIHVHAASLTEIHGFMQEVVDL